ncbi:hypothetical protein BDV41DRAFT_444831 [Aspergillus transmontanensis]|uniref:Uncharacterized protein n=1 Tax=Aspergillus transmontanensis TaxID=1034304 RepID=A0A5N6WDM7_9EURO|nr:hypothetical protein BDV41DRAFT_444831 [Aspergillus transmontanensis]
MQDSHWLILWIRSSTPYSPDFPSLWIVPLRQSVRKGFFSERPSFSPLVDQLGCLFFHYSTYNLGHYMLLAQPCTAREWVFCSLVLGSVVLGGHRLRANDAIWHEGGVTEPFVRQGKDLVCG